LIIAAYLLLCLCWSTTWEAIRLCLQGYPPLLGAALRFLLATLLLATVHALRQLATGLPRPPRLGFGLSGPRQHLALGAAGVVNGLGYGCIYLAEQKLSGGTTAVICATSPLFTLLLARLFGLEALRLRRLLGMAVGLGGVSLLFADGLRLSREYFQAMLLAGCAAALLWPLYGALLKRYAQELPPFVSTSYFLFYTALALLLCSLGRGESWPLLRLVPLSAHLGLAYLTIVGSVLAWTLYLWLLQRLELSLLSTLGLIQPVLALLLDLLLGQAELRPRGYVGAGLVVAGMALSTLYPSAKRPAANRPLPPGPPEPPPPPRPASGS
jgi:drug/metabolite transporter (DMT)-like permease